MKYIIYSIPLLIVVMLSFLLGGICYLWGFKKRHYRWGVSYINEETNLITKLVDKLN
jgi:hypothetical protein